MLQILPRQQQLVHVSQGDLKKLPRFRSPWLVRRSVEVLGAQCQDSVIKRRKGRVVLDHDGEVRAKRLLLELLPVEEWIDGMEVLEVGCEERQGA